MPSGLQDIGNEAPAYGGAGFVDNCIVQAQTSSGNASFLTAAALNLTLAASAADPFEVSVGGVRVLLIANVVFAVTNGAHNFIFIDQTGALSRTATPPTYSFTAPGAPASGDMWFDLGKNVMKTWNGAAWVTSKKVMIGYLRADGGNPTGDAVSMPIGAYPLWIWENFGDGSDGFLDVSAGTTTLDGNKKYTAVVVRGAGVITQTVGGGTKVYPLQIKSQTIIACIGTSGINLNGKGRPAVGGGVAIGTGGTTNAYGGSGGGGGGGTSAGGAGGGQERTDLFATSTANGGTAGAALGGAPGNGAAPLADPELPVYWGIGNGGGAGGGSGAANGGQGSAGGGTAFISAPVVDISAGALISADGIIGGNGVAANCGGGGGGGGGILYVRCRNFFQNGTFSAAGGGGGTAGGAGGANGGSGGAGIAKRLAA